MKNGLWIILGVLVLAVLLMSVVSAQQRSSCGIFCSIGNYLSRIFSALTGNAVLDIGKVNESINYSNFIDVSAGIAKR